MRANFSEFSHKSVKYPLIYFDLINQPDPLLFGVGTISGNPEPRTQSSIVTESINQRQQQFQVNESAPNIFFFIDIRCDDLGGHVFMGLNVPQCHRGQLLIRIQSIRLFPFSLVSIRCFMILNCLFRGKFWILNFFLPAISTVDYPNWTIILLFKFIFSE